MRFGIITAVLLSASVLFFLAAMPARADFAPNAEAAQALAVGARAPDFVAHRPYNSTYEFSAKRLSKPVVIIFYRGGWCPYCNGQLADMHTVEPKLRDAGYEVLFISTDRPEILNSSLKDPSVAIHYTLLSDPTLQAAQAFHIAFHVDDTIYAAQLKYGVDLEKTTGTKLHALPVPSVFIIDKAGTIRYVYSNPDYRVRLSGEDLWRAASNLK